MRPKQIDDVKVLAGIFVASGWLKDQGWPTLADQMEKALIPRRASRKTRPPLKNRRTP